MPELKQITRTLTAALAARLSHNPAVLVNYRAAYAVVTCTLRRRRERRALRLVRPPAGRTGHLCVLGVPG